MNRRSKHQPTHATAFLPDDVRNMCIYNLAAKGTGKSRFLGRAMSWRDLLRGYPQLVIDPAGGTIDNLLDKVLRQPPEIQRELLKRIIYIDLGNRAAVVPIPLYYRLRADEGLYQVTQRYLDMVRILDPNLQSAAVEGWDAESAMTLAEQLLAVDPYRVKRYEPVYSQQGEISSYRAIGYPLEEQRYIASRLYQGLGRFEFLVKTLDGEGGRDTPPRLLRASALDPGDYPDDELLRTVRANLHRRTAIPVPVVLNEIDQRHARWLVQGYYVKQEVGVVDDTPDTDYDEQGYRRD